MQFITLSDGNKIPVLGLGTYKSDPSEVSAAVESALLDSNYKHIDCAKDYGNEKEVGEAFSKVFSGGSVKRADVFITSKLWNTDHHPDNVETACKQTLSDLKLDYLDLYLIHWGMAFKHSTEKQPMGEDGVVLTEPVPMHDTWRAMEKLVQNGLVKSIGVANFTVPMLFDLLTYAKIKPAVNQVEIHPYYSQTGLVDFCKRNNVAVTAYSPFGAAGNVDEKPITDEKIIEIAKAHQKTPAQVLLRWIIQRDIIVIPKSIHAERIAENINVFNFELGADEMEQINSLNKNLKFIIPKWGISYFG